MKKIIYITFVDYKGKSFLGVINKISFQIRALETAGMECTLIGQHGTGAIVIMPDKTQHIMENSGHVSKRRFLADTVLREIDSADYDGAYFRFQFFCGNMEKMLENMKQRKMKTVLEIPTYPYEPELKLQGAKGIPKLICDRFFRNRCCRYIDLIGVSGSDSEVYGVPAFCMKNGLCMEDFNVTGCGYSPERLDMISVSSMMKWHGLDRVLRGMAEYYANGGEREIVLHAVGDGLMREQYEQLARELGLSDRVIFYGALYGSELDEVYEKCTVGLCALSAHIKNIMEGSPLKTVEYAARGLAIVTEIKLWFIENEDDFCLRIPWDDTPLDINGVIAMNDRLFAVDSAAERRRIRQSVEDKCDMRHNLKPVTDFFAKM